MSKPQDKTFDHVNWSAFITETQSFAGNPRPDLTTKVSGGLLSKIIRNDHFCKITEPIEFLRLISNNPGLYKQFYLKELCLTLPLFSANVRTIQPMPQRTNAGSVATFLLSETTIPNTSKEVSDLVLETISDLFKSGIPMNKDIVLQLTQLWEAMTFNQSASIVEKALIFDMALKSISVDFNKNYSAEANLYRGFSFDSVNMLVSDHNPTIINVKTALNFIQPEVEAQPLLYALKEFVSKFTTIGDHAPYTLIHPTDGYSLMDAFPLDSNPSRDSQNARTHLLGQALLRVCHDNQTLLIDLCEESLNKAMHHTSIAHGIRDFIANAPIVGPALATAPKKPKARKVARLPTTELF